MVFSGEKGRLSKLLQHGGGLPHTIDLAQVAVRIPGKDQVEDRFPWDNATYMWGVFPKMVVRKFFPPLFSSHLFVGFSIFYYKPSILGYPGCFVASLVGG